MSAWSDRRRDDVERDQLDEEIYHEGDLPETLAILVTLTLAVALLLALGAWRS